MAALQHLLNRCANVGIVEPQPALSRMMQSQLRQLGFEGVTFGTSLEDLFVANPDLDWLIVVVNHRAQIEPLRLWLTNICQVPQNKRPFLSLVMDAQLAVGLPALFASGLLSWHDSKSFSHQTFKEFFQVIKESGADDALVAGTYLRRFLKQFRAWEELVNFEHALVACRSLTPAALLPLAEGYFLSGAWLKADELLREVMLLDPASGNAIQELEARYVDPHRDKQSFAQRYGIARASLLGVPEALATVCQEVLRSLGVGEVQNLPEPGKVIDQLLSQPAPDLAIVGWDSPLAPHPRMLLQRLRIKSWSQTPLIVIADRLDRADAQLVKELRAAQVLANGSSEKKLLMTLAWVFAEQRIPREPKTIERRILQALQVKDLATAKRWAERFTGLKDASPGRKKYIEGALLFADGDYFEALKSLLQSIKKLEGDNVDVLALIGDCLTALKDTRAEIAVWRKAYKLSPHNLRYLSRLGLALKRAGKTGLAVQVLQRLEALDRDNEVVKDLRSACQGFEKSVEKELESKIEDDAIEDEILAGIERHLHKGKDRPRQEARGYGLYPFYRPLTPIKMAS